LLALADTMALSAKVQRNSTSESEISLMFDRVQSIASAEGSCTASLAGSNATQAIVVKDPVSPATVATEGMASGQSWSLTQLRMQNVQSVPGQPGVLRGSLFLQASKNKQINVGTAVFS